MALSKIVGILLLNVGLAIRYWISRRKHFRQSASGVELTSTFAKSMTTYSMERVGNFIANPLIFWGLINLLG